MPYNSYIVHTIYETLTLDDKFHDIHWATATFCDSFFFRCFFFSIISGKLSLAVSAKRIFQSKSSRETKGKQIYLVVDFVLCVLFIQTYSVVLVMNNNVRIVNLLNLLQHGL